MLCEVGYMTASEHKTYLRLAQMLHRDMLRPTVVVWLDVTPEVALERIRKRGREMELKGIDVGYLRALYETYQILLAELCKTVPVFRVPYSRGFMSAEELVPKIQKALPKLGSMISID